MSILLTGATGYIGVRLLRFLEDGGHAVRCLARQREKVAPVKLTTEVVAGDCLDEASLNGALAGVRCAYYLVHSMAAGSRFEDLDRRAAITSDARPRGLGSDASGVPVIEFRASVVIGAGSLSFQMIQALVERLPVMVCPRWVATLTQPIAVDDVLAYLVAALDLPDRRGRIFEIGGPDVVSYGDMMQEYARLRGLRRLLLPVPVLTPRLSGLWLALVTPAQARVGRALVDGLKNATVVRSPEARKAFGIEPMTLRTSFVKAIEEGAEARWKIDTRTIVVSVPPVRAFEPVRRLGGATGWCFGNLLWKARGWVIRQTATFDPRGLLGSAYWYAIYPFHALIVRGLLRRIAQRAESDVPSQSPSCVG